MEREDCASFALDPSGLPGEVDDSVCSWSFAWISACFSVEIAVGREIAVKKATCSMISDGKAPNRRSSLCFPFILISQLEDVDCCFEDRLDGKRNDGVEEKERNKDFGDNSISWTRSCLGFFGLFSGFLLTIVL